VEKKCWWRTRTERPETWTCGSGWMRVPDAPGGIRWVKWSRGHLENERCDQLAMSALRRPNLPADDGYENKPETEGVVPICRKRTVREMFNAGHQAERQM